VCEKECALTKILAQTSASFALACADHFPSMLFHASNQKPVGFANGFSCFPSPSVSGDSSRIGVRIKEQVLLRLPRPSSTRQPTDVAASCHIPQMAGGSRDSSAGTGSSSPAARKSKPCTRSPQNELQ